jgi:hypothetical protein
MKPSRTDTTRRTTATARLVAFLLLVAVFLPLGMHPGAVLADGPTNTFTGSVIADTQFRFRPDQQHERCSTAAHRHAADRMAGC